MLLSAGEGHTKMGKTTDCLQIEEKPRMTNDAFNDVCNRNAACNIRDWAAVMLPMVSDLRVQGQAAPL